MDSRPKYHSSKCLCGLPVIKTCYIFAILNSLIAGLLALACLGSLVYLGIWFHSGWIASTNEELFSLVTSVLITIATYIATAIIAIFAIILLMGIVKKSHKLVMAYLVFGIFVEIVLTLGLFNYLIIKMVGYGLSECDIVYATITVIICVFYAFILHLVKKSYVILKYNAGRNFNDMQTLCLLEADGQMILKTLA